MQFARRLNRASTWAFEMESYFLLTLQIGHLDWLLIFKLQ